jgi:hypothetical protein
MKLVLIEWIDTHTSGKGWQTFEQFEESAEPMHCRSVGWLVQDKPNCKVIVPHLAGEKNKDMVVQGRGELYIPTKAIIKIIKLK